MFESIGGAGVAGLLGVQAGSSLLNSYLQWKNLEWQKHVQNQSWDREDASVQRRVADLRAAGLSPVLAAGQGATSGPVVNTTPPQVSINGLDQLALIKSKADIDTSLAQKELLQAQAAEAGSRIMLNNAELPRIEATIKSLGASTYATYLSNKINEIKARNVTNTGQAGDSIFGKILLDTTGNMVTNKEKFLGDFKNADDAARIKKMEMLLKVIEQADKTRRSLGR
jgi:hypothetical protein